MIKTILEADFFQLTFDEIKRLYLSGRISLEQMQYYTDWRLNNG